MQPWGTNPFMPKLKSNSQKISLSKSKRTTESVEDCPEAFTATTLDNHTEEEDEEMDELESSDDAMDLDNDDFVGSSIAVKEQTIEAKLERVEIRASPIKSSHTKKKSTSKSQNELYEDIFTRENIENWKEARIKAWVNRRASPDAYYFRLVAPGETKRNGAWSSKEHQAFMDRYKEWVSNEYRVGSYWGIFSLAIPHRVGYQCMGYYRALVASGELKDETYVLENGKLKLVDKTKMRGSKAQPKEELGPQWETEQVKQLEEKVDGLLKEIHGASLQTAATKPKPKPKAKPAAIKQTGQIGKLMRQMIANPNSPIHRLEAEPEVAHLKHKDWEKEWHDRLEDYRQFLKPYLDKDVKMAHWHTKQAWRRGLTTTEMLLRKDMAIKPPLTEVNQLTETPKVQQTSLSRFFTGVKKRKIDTPDDLVSYTRIPNDLYSGVKQIKPLNKRTQADASKTIYVELDQIENMTTLLDNICQRGEKESSTQSSLECILADPPWEFYVADGKNDGRCSLNLEQFRSVMEKTVRHMSAGMIFVWTHKLIQADVVRTMYDMDCKYVENLVWFKKSVNNVHLDDPSPFFSSTKEILLMFKKGDGFEMRHQRSPDVIIDFEKPRHEWIDDEFTEPKPVAVYEMIETLLPKAGYDESIHRGRCLELWAKKKSPRREGWIAFHVNKTM